LTAYGNIYGNKGATTPGSDPQNQVDGMSLERIRRIIESLRNGSFQWKPVRRNYIPKKNGKMRPLGIPNWDDKLVQEVMRILLEAYYEPQFSSHSHGFRRRKGCHTALEEIARTFKGSVWFIEGDIKGCFDNIPHEKLAEVIRNNVHDERMVALIQGLLKAGYLEDWKWNATYSGTPQGGIISPLLANIFLDQLDQFIETKLMPIYNRGTVRRQNPPYRIAQKRARRAFSAGRTEEGLYYRKIQRATPSGDPMDKTYRRLGFVRYADDFILGFAGPKSEALAIKNEIGQFLASIGLELSEEKTKITHARTEKARFLGYELLVSQNDTKQTSQTDGIRRRSVNGAIWFGIPQDTVHKWKRKYSRNGKPIHKGEMVADSNFDIVSRYQMAFRGLAQYYSWAHNRSKTLWPLQWVMSRSLTSTLADKHKTSCKAIVDKLKTRMVVEGKEFVVLKVIVKRDHGKKPLETHWGGISLARNPAIIRDDPNHYLLHQGRTELVQRLLADKCEICGSRESVQVHHIRALKDLKKRKGREPLPHETLMAARQRKTLVVCLECHQKIHSGKL